ncbi:MAG: Fic family protein [Pseudohongiella sp.]|nr:Fic family protein [Pseudohongiella sp.]
MKIETLQITREILDIISEIDEFKGAWRALGALEPERLSALRHVATIESIGSSTRIEGSKLTDREVGKLLSNLNIESFSNRDEQEVAGYAEVMETIFHNWDDILLNENYIKHLHHDLSKYSDKDERHRGEYKKLSNSVEAFDPEGESLGIVFETTSAFDTPREMEALISWVNSAIENREHHPFLVAAVFIVTFLAIHPFQDGNGRLSRVLTALILLKSGYSYMPYSSMESVIEQNKEGYYKALRRTQASLKGEVPDWQPWVMFFLKALRKQKRNLEKKVERV